MKMVNRQSRIGGYWYTVGRSFEDDWGGWVAETAGDTNGGEGLADHAYRVLADRVERCELAPGSWLNER